MATKGGKREGAGRKPGAVTKKSRTISDTIAESGLTPLEVLIECMNGAREAGDTKAAAGYANMAAPYVHAKLASITSKNTHDGNLTIVTEFPA